SRHRHSCIPAHNRTARRTLRFTGDFNGKKCNARCQQLNRPANRSRDPRRDSWRQRPAKIIVAGLDSVLGTSTATTTTKSPDTFYVPGDLNCALLFFLRRTGGTGASLCTLTCLHFHFCGRHRVSDFYFFADLEVARHLGVRVTINFPAVLPFLDRNYRVRHFQNGTGHLVSLRACSKSCAAERKTRCCQ